MEIKENFNFDEQINRKNTKCFKWDFANTLFKSNDIIPMWIADMDFKSPNEVIEALKLRSLHGIYGYSVRTDSFYNSFIEWVDSKYNLKVEVNNLVFIPGVVFGLVLAINAFTNPNDKIIIQPPVYPPFFSVISDFNRIIVENPLIYNEDASYSIDFLDFENKIKNNNIKMFLLCSPHNPVGKCLTIEELDKILWICQKYNVIVVSDEIHSDITYEIKHIPTAKISSFKDNVITLMSPSKTFNITGLNAALAIIFNKKLHEEFEKFVKKFHVNTTNVFALEAFEAAYKHGSNWLNALLNYLKNNRDYIINFIKDNNLPIIPTIPQATFLIWLNFKNLNMSHENLKEFIIKKAKLGLNDGITFGKNGEHFMRLNFACPKSTLDKALNQLKDAIKTLFLILFFLIYILNTNSYANTNNFDILTNNNLGSYLYEKPTFFFPTFFIPKKLKPNTKQEINLITTLSPIIYYLQNKKFLYPYDAKIDTNLDESYYEFLINFQKNEKEIKKEVFLNLISKIHFISIINFLPNFISNIVQNIYIKSEIKNYSLPILLTYVTSKLNFKTALIYYQIETSKFSIFLIYLPYQTYNDHLDLTSKFLAYNKDKMQFVIGNFNFQNNQIIFDPINIIYAYSINDLLFKKDNLLKNKFQIISISNIYNFLKSQIEQKIIKDTNELQRYFQFNFLSKTHKNELINLIKNFKITMFEPKLATYSSRFSTSNSLIIKMNEDIKKEQENIILNKFKFFNDKIKKMSINLNPKVEYDFVFKKLNLKN